MKKKLLGPGLMVLFIFSCLLFAVCAGADEAGRTITLTVNGSSALSQTVTAEQNNTLIIRAPGATAVRLRVPDERRWEYYDRYQPLDYLEIRWRYGSGTRTIYADARYDDYGGYGDLEDPDSEDEWSARSSRIEITAETVPGEDSPVPSVSLSASTVQRGGWLNLNVTNAPGRGEWYWADLFEDRDGEHGIDHFDFNAANRLSLSTASLDPGSYWLRVSGVAAGYDPAETWLYFTVTAGAAQQEYFEVSAHEGIVSEDIFLSAYVPDAEWMRLRITKENDPVWGTDWRDWDGIYAHDMWNAGDPGTYEFALFASYDGEEEVLIGTPQSVTFVEQNGGNRLSRPDLSQFSGVLGEEENLTGNIIVDERAEWLDIHLNYVPVNGDPENEGWKNIYDSYREKLDGEGWTAVDLPADIFRREGLYRMDVYCHAHGISGDGATCRFYKTSAAADEDSIRLAINGSTEEYQVYESGVDLFATVNAPEATAVRLLREDWWDYDDCRNGRASWNMGFGEGDYTFIAQMTTDEPVWREDGFDWEDFSWEELNWTTISNTIRVHSHSPEGSLAVPEVIMTPDSGEVARGGFLEIEAISQGHNEWLWADVLTIRDEDPDNIWWEETQHFDSDGNSLYIKIPIFTLDPGNYYLRVGMDARGWSASEKYLPFTVLESEELSEPALIFSRDTMQANESIKVYAYAPEASYLRVDVQWNQDPNWNDWMDDDDEFLSWDWGCGRSGHYTFTLTPRYPDGTEAEPVVKELTVTADGQLEEPVISGIPSVIHTGTPVSGSFRPIAGASWYNTELWYAPENGNWQQLYRDDRDPSAEDAELLQFDGSLFAAPGRYQLSVNAAAPGLENGYTEFWIVVLEDTEPDEDLVLRLFGTTDEAAIEEMGILLYQQLKTTVQKPDDVTAVRLWNGRDWEYLTGPEESYFRMLNAFQEGEMTFVAQATTDASVTAWGQEHDGDYWGFDWSEVNWSMTSNTMTIHVTCLGNLDAPTVHMPEGNTVERGEYLEISIDPVENGWGFGVRIETPRNEDGWTDVLYNEEVMPETTILIPTDAMEPGTYTLISDSRHFGWRGKESRYPFTVTEPAGYVDEPVFRISSTEVLTNENFVVSVYAPGAEEVLFCHEGLQNRWADGPGYISCTRRCENAGEYRFRAFARYEGEEEFVEIGDGITVNASAPYGSLDGVIDAPEIGSSDRDYTFSFTWFHMGHPWNNGHINVYNEDDEEIIDLLGEDDLVVEENFTENENVFTFTFRAGSLEPGLYRIEAVMVPDEQGWNPTETWGSFFIVEDESAPHGDLPPVKIRMYEPWTEGENFHFRIDSDGAQFARYQITDEDTGELVFEDEIQNFRYPARELPVEWFETGHKYSLSVYAAGYSAEDGYRDNEAVFWFYMLPDDADVLELPSGLGTVETEAFEGIAAGKLVIPDSVGSVASRAFADCPNLMLVELPSDTSGIASDAFAGSGPVMVYGHEGSGAEAYASRSDDISFIYLYD